MGSGPCGQIEKVEMDTALIHWYGGLKTIRFNVGMYSVEWFQSSQSNRDPLVRKQASGSLAQFKRQERVKNIEVEMDTALIHWFENKPVVPLHNSSARRE